MVSSASLLPPPPQYKQLKWVADSASPRRQAGSPASVSAAPAPGSEQTCFLWNGRECTGVALHKAVLQGEVDTATRILDNGCADVDARFSYCTFYKGKAQEGSGEAIHLAASRGHIELARLLLARGAKLAAMVTRDHHEHYDVLHAAIFAEGRGCNDEMVGYLISAKAPLATNLDGRTPLHLAYQVGSVRMIPVLRHEMNQRGLLKQIYDNPNQPAPLLLGIKMGKMTVRQLAKAAPETPHSLRIFVNNEPRCIPHFLRHIQHGGRVSAQQLASHLCGGELAKVLRDWPTAASALFDAITERPEVEHPGWHPLPRRMSFAPQGMSECMFSMVNPNRQLLVHYVPEFEWKYDVTRFEAPPWHETLQDPTGGSPVHDVDIRVCYVPGIICAEFFSALAESDAVGEHGIFTNQVVVGSIEYVWWRGAYRVDIFQVLISLWCLALLILEGWFVEGDSAPRELKPAASPRLGDGGLVAALSPEESIERAVKVSAAFIGAKGVVDVVHELLQFSGCLRIGRVRDYFNFGNAFDLFRSCMLTMMFFDTGNATVRVLVIFICWMRLTEAFTSAEKIAIALLPLKRLVWSLVPAMVMTLVGFCAFTHVFHFIWGHHHDWKRTLLRSFGTLITTQLPTEPLDLTSLELAVTYGAVLFFSVFIMNIFIGVIGTQYEQEQSQVPCTFMHHRAQCCVAFLLRARILPCAICGRTCAKVVTLLAVLSTVALQVFSIAQDKPRFTKGAFVALELIMLLMTYQDPTCQWTPVQDKNKRRYLWLSIPRKDRDVCESEEDLEDGLPSENKLPARSQSDGTVPMLLKELSLVSAWDHLSPKRNPIVDR